MSKKRPPTYRPPMDRIDEVIARLRATGFDDDAVIVELLGAEARKFYVEMARKYTGSTGPM